MKSARLTVSLSLAVLMIAVFPLIAAAQDDTDGFFRYPDVHGDLIVFTSESDLWSASLTDGAVARRLTRHPGKEQYARISPDGKQIAFTGQYDGNWDVFVMPVDGGQPQRLTFHPGADEVVGWSDDGRSILFRSNRYEPNRAWNLYSVSVEGGYPKSLGLDKGTRISYEPGGDRFAYTRLRREQRPWKRYKGGWAMDLWMGNLKTMQFSKLTTFEGTDAFPMWIGDRIYYLSDQSGRFNIQSMNPDGSGIRQHTRHEEWDARWPSTDGKTIVYQLAMDIRAYDIESGETRMVDIDLPSDRYRMRDRIIEDAKKYIDYSSIPNSGKRVAVTSRGEAFTMPVEEKGYIRQLSRTQGARELWVEYSPDGKQIAVMSDASGEYEIWLYPSKGGDPKQLTKRGAMWRFPMRWSPDGKYIAFADKATRLWIVDAETGKATQVDEAPGWETRHYEWSPDSKWIGWLQMQDDWDQEIAFYHIETKEKFKLDRPLTNESDFSFAPDGRYVYFISGTWYNPMIGLSAGGYIYGPGNKLYALALAKDTPNPFSPELVEAYDEEEEADEKEEKEEDGDGEEEELTVTIEKAGLEDRVYELDIRAGYWGGLNATEGRLYFAEGDNRGMMPAEKGSPGNALYTYSIEDEKLEKVEDGITRIRTSADRKKLLLTKPGNA
ncbi:hypothetical protein GF324_00220, partial [bacterium]|nr:hypothetical protein [bacterium]